MGIEIGDPGFNSHQARFGFYIFSIGSGLIYDKNNSHTLTFLSKTCEMMLLLGINY